MSLGIDLLGWQWPISTFQAIRNVQHNMRGGWKITRLVTSIFMSAAALGAICFSCTSEVDENNGTSTDSKVFLVGGCIYGVCGIANAVVVVAKCIGKRRVIQREEANNGNVGLLKGKMIVCALPEMGASIISMNYSALILIRFAFYPSSNWLGIQYLVGGISMGLYVLDAALALCDLICLDIDERDMEEAARRRRINVVLGWPQHPNGGEGMPMMVMPPQDQDLGAMRGRG